jgi:hypothetical protein
VDTVDYLALYRQELARRAAEAQRGSQPVS